MKLSEFLLNARDFGIARPYVVAEVGVNHEGSLDTARHLIDLAVDAGADAVKFQTYRAETLASKDSPAYWDTTKEPTTSQFELFSRHDSFWKAECEQLKAHCDARGIEFLSTPFDLESAEFLDELMPAYKVSSSDLTNLPFIDAICRKGKPVLLSTGASTLSEIVEAVELIHQHGNLLVLMHCVLNYPTRDQDANLGMLLDLRRRFPELVLGYSDHTLPNPEMDILMTAWLLGAVVLEKHFTHDKELPGNDHYHAMDAVDLRVFRERADREVLLLGEFNKRPIPSEEIARKNARRSLVAARDIPVGGIVAAEDVTWKRPATGISPRDLPNLVGRRARHRVEADTVLQWNMFD